MTIRNEPTLTEEAYADNPKRGRRRVLQIADLHRTPVICTQGKVIPDLIAWWCERDGVRPDKSRNRKGSTWVLSLADGRLVAADHIGSALATNVVTWHADSPRSVSIEPAPRRICVLMRLAPTCGRAGPRPSWPEPSSRRASWPEPCCAGAFFTASW